MKTQFRNLVFEGGGMKGIAYVGAMQVLDQRGHLAGICRVGGTSAGAINALLFALGYSIQEQHTILDSTDFKKFMDHSFGIVRDINRVMKKFGWNKGDYFENWIGELVEKKLGSKRTTFQDLKDAKMPDLYVTGTNLSTGYVEVFSAERHPDMALTDALRISMSIPLFFAAVRHGKRKDVYVDGGVILNYPVKLFDREKYIDMISEPQAARRVEYYNRENAEFLLKQPDRSPYVYNRQTLGLRLDSSEEIGLFRYGEPVDGEKIVDFFDYAKALISSVMKVQENQHLHSDDWQRTLYINTLDIGTTDFNLSKEKKLALIREGINGAEKYFEWFESPVESPANRI
ncbi:MAG: patatin-like phospholipase family protein [Deltaproteobacteria bacterium]|jgi:NTE family protein|nr:patatin-like phospholipase family protein [Deltaproteobacteria bacterium]